MLEPQDIQAIGNLVDEKIKANNLSNNAELTGSLSAIMDEKIKANNVSLGEIMDEKIKANNISLGEIMDEKIKANNISLGEIMDEKIKANNVSLGEIMDEKIKANNVSLGTIMDEKIKTNIKENNSVLIGMMGEMVEQMILPRIDSLEQRVDGLEKTVANLPTKSYLSEKLADAVSDTVKMIDKRQEARDRMDREYKSTVVDIVEEHELATPSQVATLKNNISPAATPASV